MKLNVTKKVNGKQDQRYKNQGFLKPGQSIPMLKRKGIKKLFKKIINGKIIEKIFFVTL